MESVFILDEQRTVLHTHRRKKRQIVIDNPALRVYDSHRSAATQHLCLLDLLTNQITKKQHYSCSTRLKWIDSTSTIIS